MTYIIQNIITDLPLDILIYLSKFTKINKLLLSCKKLHDNKKYLDWKLTKKYSYEFYNNVNFREIVISKIYDTKKQLYMSYYFDV